MNPMITTRALTKTYRGRTVVDDLALDVPEGVVYGFLGPNGAGKSTTMKMLLGLTQPTSGEISLFGERLTRASRARMLPAIGSMIEAPPGYGHLTGRENMRVVQDMLGLSDAQVDWALTTVRLTDNQHKLVRAYSLGMKQRLGIAMALARTPRLLILDEPTNGLDPAGIEEIRALIVDLAAQGVTVMVSSHLLDEIDKMASVLGILAEGRMLFQGTRAELFEQSIPDLLIETSVPSAALNRLEALELVPPRGAAGTAAALEAPGAFRLSGIDRETGARIVRELAVAGVPLYEVRRVQQSLEEVFMHLTGSGGLR